MENIDTKNLTVTIIPYVDTQIVQLLRIIPDHMYYYVIIFFSTLFALFSLFGISANVLNIVVYWKIGVRETCNITFIALSLWDLNICVLSLLIVLWFILDTCHLLPHLTIVSIQYVYIAYTRGFLYILSTLATVYLSIERSVCVVLPFYVKEIFNNRCTVLINLLIIIFGLVSYCPAWSTQGIQWINDPRTNMTHIGVWLSANRRDIDLFLDTLKGMVLPVVAQGLILVSAGFMIQGIKKGSEFRHQAANIMKSKSISATRRSNYIVKTQIMTRKDMKLTQVVVFLAMIFFVCNFPVFVIAFIRATILEIYTVRQENNLYAVLYLTVYLCGTINSSVNIIVYYFVSTKYRQKFRNVFCTLSR